MGTKRNPPKNSLKRGSEDGSIFMDEPGEEFSTKKICTRQNPTICKICKENCIERSIICTVCKSNFHLECVNMPGTFYDFFIIKNKMPWKCPPCCMSISEDTSTRTKIMDEKIQKLKEKMDIYEKKIELRMTSQDTQMDMVLDMVTKSSDIQDRKLLDFENKLENTNDRITKEICFIQGQNKVDELIISGIPHQQNENLKRYIINVAKSMGIIITPDEIKKIHRLTGQPNTKTDKIAPIMVKFISQDIRDAINDKYVESMKKKIFLTLSSAITLATTQIDHRIYINPHLPQCLREIHQTALQLKKEGKIEAVHTKINAVATKINGSWHKIQTMKELRIAINGKPLSGAD